MGRSQHGRARGNGKRVNQICHFGIMGGLAPLTGVPLAHRSYIQKHATTNISIPPGCEAGRRWMMGHNPYRKYLLSKNPVGAGRVDVIKKSKRKCNCGPRPRGDGSQVGTHIFAELTPSAYPYGHGHGHTHPHGYPPHHHPHPNDLCLSWRTCKVSPGATCYTTEDCPLIDLGGDQHFVAGHVNTQLRFGEPTPTDAVVVFVGVPTEPALTITEYRVPRPGGTTVMLSGNEQHFPANKVTVIGKLGMPSEPGGHHEITRPYYRIDSDKIINGNQGSATTSTSCWDWYQLRRRHRKGKSP